jgi:hypothetical protein
MPCAFALRTGGFTGTRGTLFVRRAIFRLYFYPAHIEAQM